MNDISTQYNKLLDEGISITEIYIYHLIVSDERSYGMSEKEMLDLVDRATNARYSSSRSLEDIIDGLLNGDEFDGDDEEWY